MTGEEGGHLELADRAHLPPPAGDRSGGTWQEPAAARVLTTVTYVGAMLSGLMIGLREGWSRWLSLAVLVPSVLITVILTTRSSLLLPLALGASSYIATSIATGKAPS